MIGYYVHQHGYGHLARALSITERMTRPVTVLTSREVPQDNPFTDVIALPRDDTADTVHEPTAHGALHWAPHFDTGYTARMNAIAAWVRDARPEAMVVDVSVEVATFARLLGVPVVVIALPGHRTDAPHALVHTLADRIIAAWPRELRVPEWLRPHDHKTVYVGGISRFDGRPVPPHATKGNVVVLSGAGGIDVAQSAGTESADWTWLGGQHGDWISDPWPHLVGADVIITHAGQNSIADTAAARRPAIVIPQRRPFGEQHTTATVLDRHGLAAIAFEWPAPEGWGELIRRAYGIGGEQWQRWRVHGAAGRAAAAIEETARACRGVVSA
ncbi:glycosyltransferase [Mycolicibacterium neoaurum]|uniref:glycosyltransferase n=1 Tax=Mycolicibacterium neoaurum TaxID=1795 RepID=UPI00248D03E3|nr:glycosyltransferase [Mycolicibacterium neoaurum]WBP92751.1 glycosyltransferase [Mycolicibacterium neoaurum]WBS06313.1 glycosyltransferase [Mycolicibacterium neoaurum]